jgi:quinol-cytochrome oxidoreductase complex cytochrome b subunit
MEVFVMMVLLVMVCVLAILALLDQSVCKMIVYRDIMGVTALVYALTVMK